MPVGTGTGGPDGAPFPPDQAGITSLWDLEVLRTGAGSMARDDTSTDSRYDSLSQRVSSLESRRDRSVDQAISPVSKRIDDLASELKDAQRDLRRLDAEFQKHRDKVRQQQTLIAGRREADSLTAAVEAELELIINILVSAVPSKRPTFDELLRHTEIPP